jgi:hypothetical protein
MSFYLDNSVPSDKNESNENASNEKESNQDCVSLNLVLITKNFNKNNFFEVKMEHGLYVIWNTAMKKFYVNQSNNVPARLSSHWNELKIRRHVK